MVETLLGKTSLVKHESNKLCSICLCSKKTRDVFPLSQSNAIEIFNLIHCDLWDPYNSTFTCGASYFVTIVDDYSRSVDLFDC